MEINSMSGMSGVQMGGMGSMQGMRRPPGDPSQHAEKMSARIMEQQDADQDGQLSASELTTESSSGSDLIANLDTNGDGIVSQEELQAGLQSNMESAKSSFESGNAPSDEDRAFMQQMHQLAGDSPGSRAKATQAYGLMQEAMTSGDTYNTDQMLLDTLNTAV